MQKHKKRVSATTTACYTTAYAVNVLMISDSFESSTKTPTRHNKDNSPSYVTHLFPQPGKKDIRVAFWLHLTPPGPGIHIHYTDYPDLFLVLIYTQLNHIKSAFRLASFPPLSQAAFISQSFHLLSR